MYGKYYEPKTLIDQYLFWVYNNSMTTVIFKKDNVHDAIVWCQRQFGPGSFDIDNQFPSWNWQFRFHDARNATHFALQWL